MSDLSDYPDDVANPYWDDCEWEESSRVCEKCGLRMWEAPWFDNPEEGGGACIGTQICCGSCGDYDGFLEFVSKYHAACVKFPKAKVGVCR